jgi:hypothetical protein
MLDISLLFFLNNFQLKFALLQIICANPIKSVKSVTRRKLISCKPLDKFLWNSYQKKIAKKSHKILNNYKNIKFYTCNGFYMSHGIAHMHCSSIVSHFNISLKGCVASFPKNSKLSINFFFAIISTDFNNITAKFFYVQIKLKISFIFLKKW